MSRWYRAYAGTVTDAKLGEVSLVAGCSRSVAIAAWHCILESAAEENDEGRFTATPRRIAVILAEPIATMEAVFAELHALGMIDQGEVTAWKRRQFVADTSTERSRKHRDAKRNVDATLQQQDATLQQQDATLQQQDATLQQQDATPPYTDTDTDTDTDASASESARARATPVGFDRFWNAYPNKVGKAAALKAFTAASKRTDLETMLRGLAAYVNKRDDRPWCNPATWLNQDRWTDIPAEPVMPQAASPPRGRSQHNQILSIADKVAADERAKSQIPDRTVELLPAVRW